MTAIQRLLREYSLLSAAVTATLGFVLLMEWVVLSQVQFGALLEVIAVWLLVLRYVVTPIASPVLKPGTLVNVATDAYPIGVVTTPEDAEAI